MEEMQGIMSLPQIGGAAPQPRANPQEEALFEQLREQVPPKQFSDELLSGAMQADPQAVKEFVDELRAQSIPMDMLMLLNKMVDEILYTPQDYQRIRRQYMQQGIPEDILPAQFDPMFFVALNMALDYLTVEQPAPMGMARGGIADLAQYGRFGDTMLAHITPEEAALLKARGGSGTINPVTGLPEFFLGKLFKSIGNAVKKFAQSSIGRIVLPIALGFFIGPAAAGFMGVTSTAGIAAVSGFVGGAGTAILQGKNIGEAIKAGAIGGVTAGATAGIMGGADAFASAQAPAPISAAGAETLVSPVDTAPAALPSLDSAAQTPAADTVVGAPLAPRVPGMEFDAARVPMAGNTFSPIDQYQKVIGDYQASIGEIDPTTLNRGYPVGSTHQTRLNVLNEALANDSGVGRFAAPGTGDLGQFAMQGPGMGPPPPMSAGPAPELSDPIARRVSIANPDAYKVPVPAQSVPAQLGQGMEFESIGYGRGSAPPPPPSLMDQASGLYDKAAGLYDKYMPEALGGSRGAVPAKVIEEAKAAFNAEMASSKSPFLARQAYDAVIKAGTPGILSTYGPAAALGLGAMALGGGFKETPAAAPNMAAFDFANPAYAKPLTFGGLQGSRGYAPRRPPGYAQGGIMALEMGGTTYPRKQGHINGPGTGTSDSIPALLSDGEFVFTAKAVRNLGNGSRKKGAKRLYSMMKMLEERKV